MAPPAAPPAPPDKAAGTGELRLDPALQGARIQAVQQPDGYTVLLETHRAGVGTARWLCGVSAETARFGRTFQRRRSGGPPPVFCQWLRSRVEGGRVETLRLRHAQVLELRIVHGAETWLLVLELNRRDSNLLLLDGDERLLIALRHPALPGRSLGPGDPYRPPPRLHPWPAGSVLAERYPAPDEAAARALEQAWLERETTAALDARRRPALQEVRRAAKRVQRRLAHLAQDLAAARQAELWRRRGELLQIHRGRLRAGMERITVPDMFEPGEPEVTIELEARADPGANIERCFRLYRKRRAAVPHLQARMAASEAERDAWETLAGRLQAAESLADLERAADALPPGAGPLHALLLGESSGKPRAAASDKQPMRRYSADGYAILIGRSGAENDRVTFRLARGRDWWFHAQGVPGSHVVVLNPADGPLPPQTLREAAWLAAHYSQARSAAQAEVDCTQRKHVRKVPRGEPGQVTFSQNRTVHVRLDDAELRRVLERTVEEG